MAIDIRAHYGFWIELLASNYAKDLAALPEGAYTTSIGGACRTAQNISTEIVLMTRVAKDVLEGGEIPGRDPAKFASLMEELSTPEAAAQAVKDAAKEAGAAFAAASDETLAREVMMPWGMSMSLYALAHLCATHINYHDAQLNYIQSFHGDTEMHWF
ncbi:MAG: DinB family protein [Chthonomonas sp.]|nr:DinB family protein [Chthonomonas sp.]